MEDLREQAAQLMGFLKSNVHTMHADGAGQMRCITH